MQENHSKVERQEPQMFYLQNNNNNHSGQAKTDGKDCGKFENEPASHDHREIVRSSHRTIQYPRRPTRACGPNLNGRT